MPIYETDDLVVDNSATEEPTATVPSGFWYAGRIVGNWDGCTITPQMIGAKTAAIPQPGEQNASMPVVLTEDGYFRFFAVCPKIEFRTSTDSNFANSTIGASTDLVITVTRERITK